MVVPFRITWRVEGALFRRVTHRCLRLPFSHMMPTRLAVRQQLRRTLTMRMNTPLLLQALVQRRSEEGRASLHWYAVTASKPAPQLRMPLRTHAICARALPNSIRLSPDPEAS